MKNNWFLLYSLCIFQRRFKKRISKRKTTSPKNARPLAEGFFPCSTRRALPCVWRSVDTTREPVRNWPFVCHVNRYVKWNNHHRSEQLREICNSLSSRAAVGLHINSIINSIVFPTSGQSAITRETIPWPCIMLYQIPKVPRLPATAVLSLPPMLIQRSLLDVAGCVTNTRPLTPPEKFVLFACSAFRKQRQTPGAMAHHVMRNSPQSSGGLFFYTSENDCPLSSLTLSVTTRARESSTPQQFQLFLLQRVRIPVRCQASPSRLLLGRASLPLHSNSTVNPRQISEFQVSTYRPGRRGKKCLYYCTLGPCRHTCITCVVPNLHFSKDPRRAVPLLVHNCTSIHQQKFHQSHPYTSRWLLQDRDFLTWFFTFYFGMLLDVTPTTGVAKPSFKRPRALEVHADPFIRSVIMKTTINDDVIRQ